MPVTQQDIAEKLGVSRRLVSYALTSESRVSPEMQSRILQVAAEMGYQPNRAARALVTGRTDQIALCVPTLSNNFHAEFIRHFEAFAQNTPYDLLITTVGGKEDALLKLAVDGMLLYRSSPIPVQKLPYPVVVLQSPPTRPTPEIDNAFDHVLLELSEASLAAMRHLQEQKAKRIAFVSLKGILLPDEPRYATYLEVMQQAELQPEVIGLDYNWDKNLRPLAHSVLEEYFRAHGFPDALFCCNDEVAIGAYRALRALGRSVPNETMVIGCDDIPEIEDLVPALSSIRHSWEDVCESAWEMLVTRIENPALPVRRAAFPGKLVVRDSSCRAL